MTARAVIAWWATGMLALVTAVGTGSGASADEPGIVVEDGVTQPVFGYDDAVRERVFIDSPYDSDADGVLDIITVDIMRPAASDQGLKVPVIMDPSPYYTTLGRGNEGELKIDADGDGLLDKWPLFYDNYFIRCDLLACQSLDELWSCCQPKRRLERHRCVKITATHQEAHDGQATEDRSRPPGVGKLEG